MGLLIDVLGIDLGIVKFDCAQEVEALLLHKVAVLVSPLHLQLFHLSSNSIEFIEVVRLFLKNFERVLRVMVLRTSIRADRIILVPRLSHKPDITMIFLVSVM